MAMFTAYFDASGKKTATGPKRAMYVAGFVASVSEWKKFEVTWPRLLARHKLPNPFRMSDFMARHNPNYSGPYKGWKGDELRFRTDVVMLAKRHTNSPFAAGVTNENLRRMFDEYDVPPKEPRAPFPWCGLHVCRAALVWQGKRVRAGKRTDMKIVFEDGDEDRGELGPALWDWYKREVTFEGNKGKHFAPFAVCDVLAWEFRRWTERREIGHETLGRIGQTTDRDEKIRLTLSAMEGIDPAPMIPYLLRHLPKTMLLYATWDLLKQYCERAGYPKRIKP
jgi:hypothetical protein